MGEEEKKPEAKEPEEEKKKPEEAPKAEKPADDGKEEKKSEESEKSPPPPPPPQEIVLKVFMHCEGCARKVRRCLKGFEGVEDVLTDCRASKVVVKGEKADPLKVLARVLRKSHRQVELISPIPKPPPEEPNKPEEKVAKAEEKKEEIPVVTVILKVFMHCEACAQEIKKRILRMKGVESAEAELKSSEVTVKGAFQAEKLADYVHRRTGKHAVVVKVEPEKKAAEVEEKKKEEEKKPEEGQKEEVKKNEEALGKASNEGGGDTPAGAPPKLEIKKNEYIYPYYPPLNHQQVYYPPLNQQQTYYPQKYVQEYNHYGYYESPQMFSDENPNACSLM